MPLHDVAKAVVEGCVRISEATSKRCVCGGHACSCKRWGGSIVVMGDGMVLTAEQ